MDEVAELLKVAQRNIGFAQSTVTIDQQERAICAAIAQAAAQTAQAMIMHERGTLTIERLGEYAIATVGMAGKLEVQSDE